MNFFADLIEQFGVVLKNKNALTVKSIKSYISDVKGYIRWAGSQNYNLKLEEYFNQSILQVYFDYLIKNTSYVSFRKKINSIKLFVMFLKEKGYRIDNFIIDFKARTLKDKFKKDIEEHITYKYLTEYFKNVKNAPLKDKAIIAIFVYTGIKVSEFVNLQIGDVFLENYPRIVIRKGAKREIPLHKNLVNILRDYIDIYNPKEDLFLSQKGEYGPSGVYRVVNKYSPKDLKISPNNIRRSFSYTLSYLGASTDIVYNVLGATKPKYVMFKPTSYEEVSKYINRIDVDLK